MPSRRVTEQVVSTARYDIVGSDSEHGPGFIRHTGLARDTAQYDRSSVGVINMGPPLRTADRMFADATGTAGLSEDEDRKIKDFVDRHVGEHASAQKAGRELLTRAYCVLPHATRLAEADGRYTRTRFSCAGFVVEAYKRARIALVDEEGLPLVGLEQIKQAYPDFAPMLDREEVRISVGLTGHGPWPVILCGYLFHAMARDAAAIRRDVYVARPGDEVFL
jgi:hypothetical protein